MVVALAGAGFYFGTISSRSFQVNERVLTAISTLLRPLAYRLNIRSASAHQGHAVGDRNRRQIPVPPWRRSGYRAQGCAQRHQCRHCAGCQPAQGMIVDAPKAFSALDKEQAGVQKEMVDQLLTSECPGAARQVQQMGQGWVLVKLGRCNLLGLCLQLVVA
jgi:hypothetical protein